MLGVLLGSGCGWCGAEMCGWCGVLTCAAGVVLCCVRLVWWICMPRSQEEHEMGLHEQQQVQVPVARALLVPTLIAAVWLAC